MHKGLPTKGVDEDLPTKFPLLVHMKSSAASTSLLLERVRDFVYLRFSQVLLLGSAPTGLRRLELSFGKSLLCTKDFLSLHMPSVCKYFGRHDLSVVAPETKRASVFLV